ncbi:hypothetical protein Tco_1029737 [Tanacetum coccineum]|uniref:Uncharacterized protein n=1 Tax=Tanacetum coccineum TaxID=301880 RepID=A0ABQ5G4T5_9ASTR
MALGYQNPFYLKQAQRKHQCLYDGKVLTLKSIDPPVVHDSEETLQLAQENSNQLVGGIAELYGRVGIHHGSLELRVSRLILFRDLQWGNLLIHQGLFVEGSGAQSFPQWQFCDSDCRAIASACYTQNLLFLHVFGLSVIPRMIVKILGKPWGAKELFSASVCLKTSSSQTPNGILQTTAYTAPTPTNSSSQATNCPNSSQDVDELETQQHGQHQPATIADNVPNAMFDENTFVNPFATVHPHEILESHSHNMWIYRTMHNVLTNHTLHDFTMDYRSPSGTIIGEETISDHFDKESLRILW